MNRSAALWGIAVVLGSCAEHRSAMVTAETSTERPTRTSPSEQLRQNSEAANPGLAKQPARNRPWVRPSALAGSWYPRERTLVIAEIARMRRESLGAPTLAGKPLALVVPHAGWQYSGVASMAAFRGLQRGDFARVVLVGPSHTSDFGGFSVSSARAYATPLGEVPLCQTAASLRDQNLVRDLPEADAHEHSLEIELPLLQERLGSFCLVPIVVGRTNPDMERQLALKLGGLHDGKTLFVFSSDFVHYGPRFDYTPFGPSAVQARPQIRALEDQAINLLKAKDLGGFRKFLDDYQPTICGRRGLSVLLELLQHSAPAAEPVLLAHYASSELPQSIGDQEDRANAVGYVALAYLEKPSLGSAMGAPLGAPRALVTASPQAPPLGQEQGDALVRIARATLYGELARGAELEQVLGSLPQASALDRRQAAFVTLTEAGRLRGCVGQVEPQYWLPEAVVHAALEAALYDSRFVPVSPEELPRIAVEVTVLSLPRPVRSWNEIVLGRDGIVLEKNGRRALFLPQVPGEQGWTLPQTLTALAHKAGLAQEAWRARDARFLVFTGQEFREKN